MKEPSPEELSKYATSGDLERKRDIEKGKADKRRPAENLPLTEREAKIDFLHTKYEELTEHLSKIMISKTTWSGNPRMVTHGSSVLATDAEGKRLHMNWEVNPKGIQVAEATLEQIREVLDQIKELEETK